jgi:23S rRNA pseudouridine1911/1915/1917 synthase
MTMVTAEPAKGVQEAILDYHVMNHGAYLSRVKVLLRTGRTHQIRVQFASRGMPLVGERKYSLMDDPCEIALWSHKIGFYHPGDGQWMTFSKEPSAVYPWTAV